MTGHIAARHLAAAARNVPCRRTLSQSAARPFSAAWDLASPSASTSAPAGESPRQASKATTSGSTTSPTISQASASAQPSKSAEASSVPFDAIPPPASAPPGETALHDWSRSFHGLSAQPFPKEVADVLLAPIDPNDIEIKPDGLIYLPEIKYRRILNRAFGPGGWGLAPRGETNIGNKIVSREYALVCLGRLVGVARGEQEYFDPSGVATATEGCKSNALMRTCKDLGIGSELWDPRFISKFKAKYGVEVWAEHVVTKKKRKLWRRKDDKLSSPYEEKK